MLEKTPDYNQHPKSPHQTTAGVDLAPVVISPSLLLHRLEIFVYFFMLVSASIAILPFLFTAFYWPLVWLVFALIIVAALRASWRVKSKPPVRLSVTQKVWHLQTSDGELVVKPCGDILVWAKLIVVPVKISSSGRKQFIIALPDSMLEEDWRRLRVWLRMALRKNN